MLKVVLIYVLCIRCQNNLRSVKDLSFPLIYRLLTWFFMSLSFFNVFRARYSCVDLQLWTHEIAFKYNNNLGFLRF